MMENLALSKAVYRISRRVFQKEFLGKIQFLPLFLDPYNGMQNFRGCGNEL